MTTNNITTIATINAETAIDVTIDGLNTMLNPNPDVIQVEAEVIPNEEPITRHQYAKYDANGARTRAWFLENVGPDMTGVNTLEAALKMAELDYTVTKIPASYNINAGIKGMPPRYVKVPGWFTLIREDTREVMGMVQGRYEILQNRDAFNFLDTLIGEGAKIETASSWGPHNSRSFICMSIEDVDILGDKFTPYFVLMNGFDGKQSVRCAFLSERVWCHNMINRAFKKALASFNIRHNTAMSDHLTVAHQILSADAKQIHALKAQAELLALKPFNESQFLTWAHDMFPVQGEGLAKRTITMNTQKLDLLMECYRMDDLNNIRGSAWGAIQAVSDFESHLVAPSGRRERPELAMFNTTVQKEMPILNNLWNLVDSF